MKKYLKIILLICAVTVLGAAALLCGCGGNTQTGNNDTDITENDEPVTDKDIDGITFNGATYTYDGTEREIIINGVLPQGVSVTYSDNKGTDAGVYNASAVLSGDGYKTLTLNATLTIQKATFTGLTFEDRSFVADNSEHEITVSGDLPEGSSVEYTDNKATKAGEYNAVAVISNPNYFTLTLNAKLTVKSLAGVALELVSSLLNKADPWSFVPEAFDKEAMAYASMPVGGVEGFSDFVSTQSIKGKFIGKQLKVMYSVLNNASTIMEYADLVFNAGSSIAEVYQKYINQNPDDYAQFSGELSGLKFRIVLDGENSQLLAGNSTVSAELSYNNRTKLRVGRIQITDGATLKYEASDNEMKFAVQASVSGAVVTTMLQFVRNQDAVAGYLYEYAGTESNGLKTSAVIASNSDYLKITATKRETDDLIIEAYQEVYDAKTGEFIGAETAEKVKNISYDTYWFNLSDVSGISTVKVSDEVNGVNADTIYINGGAEAIHTKLMMTLGGLSKATSRRFDIEMKEVWYVVAVKDGDKVSCQMEKTLIPMLFVQSEATDTFGEDFYSVNQNYMSASPTIGEGIISEVHSDFAAQKLLLESVKENVNYSAIVEYIGEKNLFFN